MTASYGAPDVLRVDGPGRAPPSGSRRRPCPAGIGRVLGHRLQPFVDRVLVRSEKAVYSGRHRTVAFIDGQLVAVLDRPTDLADVAEVDLRIDALAEQVHAQRDQADVAGPLTVAEQASSIRSAPAR